MALLVERGFYPQMISALSGLALAIRMLASSYGILRVFRQGKLKSHWFLAVVLFALLTFLSGLMHPSEQSLLSLFAQSFQLVGMASFLLYCLDASGKEMKSALFICVAIVTFLAFATIFLTNNGLTHDVAAASRLYSFGGKNLFFVSMLPMVMLSAIWPPWGKRWFPFVLSAVLAVISHYIDSSNSMACYFILALMLIPIGNGYLFSKVNPVLAVFLVFAVFAGTVLTSFIADTLGFVFDMLGREQTFSSRDSIWSVALNMFLSNPIAGVGSGVSYTVSFSSGDLNTSNAHCFYLGILSQYGLMGFAPFAVLMTVLVKKGRDGMGNGLVAGCMAAFAALLLHSVFDDLPLHYMVLLTFVVFHSCDLSGITQKPCDDAKRSM